jgi:hypothetical protein
MAFASVTGTPLSKLYLRADGLQQRATTTTRSKESLLSTLLYFEVANGPLQGWAPNHLALFTVPETTHSKLYFRTAWLALQGYRNNTLPVLSSNSLASDALPVLSLDSFVSLGLFKDPIQALDSDCSALSRVTNDPRHDSLYSKLCLRNACLKIGSHNDSLQALSSDRYASFRVNDYSLQALSSSSLVFRRVAQAAKPTRSKLWLPSTVLWSDERRAPSRVFRLHWLTVGSPQ